MPSIEVTELSSPGCFHCREFERFWGEIKSGFPNVAMKKVDVTSEEGMALVQKHGIFASPGILINGEVFSVGGVNKKEFVEKLKSLSR